MFSFNTTLKLNPGWEKNTLAVGSPPPLPHSHTARVNLSCLGGAENGKIVTLLLYYCINMYKWMRMEGLADILH